MTVADLTVQTVPVDQVTEHPSNPRRGDVSVIRESLRVHGQYVPIVVQQSTGYVVKGNHTLRAIRELGWPQVRAVFLDIDDEQAARIMVVDNRSSDVASNDDEILTQILVDLAATNSGLEGTGYDQAELDRLLATLEPSEPIPDYGPLADRFGYPPFTILDTRTGTWQDRKKAWLNLGIQSEVGRDDHLVFPAFDEERYRNMDGPAMKRGTSVFDPVICELHYLWFTDPGDRIIDPFAGGSVRGIVASVLDRQYTGIELRPEQVQANRAQLRLATGPDPEWIEGDSARVLPTITDTFDYLFTCPPYADLERYSDDPADISNMTFGEFCDAYRTILTAACDLLDDDRFATIVLSDVRDSTGHCRNLLGITTDVMADAGLRLYNDAVLVNPVGSLAFRTSRVFPIARKLGRTHQNVLTYVKGDGEKAGRRLQPIVLPELPAPETDDE